MRSGISDILINKTSIQGVTGYRRGELPLELSLPALVEGENASGRKFKETTELLEASAQEARFYLKTPVRIGSFLRLSMKIPATPLLIHPLLLEISGEVKKVELNGQGRSGHLVTLELSRKYRLQPLSTSRR